MDFRESLFNYYCTNVRIVFDLRDLWFGLMLHINPCIRHLRIVWYLFSFRENVHTKPFFFHLFFLFFGSFIRSFLNLLILSIAIFCFLLFNFHLCFCYVCLFRSFLCPYIHLCCWKFTFPSTAHLLNYAFIPSLCLP